MKALNIIKSYKIKLFFLLILSILIILIIVATKKGKILVIEDTLSGSNEKFYLEDNSFVLSYTHSVHKTVFEEYYVVTDDNRLLLQKNVFDSFGVGSPYIDDYDKFKLEDGKFVLQLERYFDTINMIISPIPKHKITIDDNEYALLDFLKEEDSPLKLYAIERYVITIWNKHIIMKY